MRVVPSTCVFGRETEKERQRVPPACMRSMIHRGMFMLHAHACVRACVKCRMRQREIELLRMHNMSNLCECVREARQNMRTLLATEARRALASWEDVHFGRENDSLWRRIHRPFGLTMHTVILSHAQPRPLSCPKPLATSRSPPPLHPRPPSLQHSQSTSSSQTCTPWSAFSSVSRQQHQLRRLVVCFLLNGFPPHLGSVFSEILEGGRRKRVSYEICDESYS